jgi:hypothetical protein
MKKLILSVAVVLSASASFSQEEKNYLPEAGDWAVGIDATPFLNYAGNLLGGGNSAPSWNALTSQVITGKYFIDANTAYRGGLRIGFASNSYTELSLEDTDETFTYPEAPHTVEDNGKISQTNIAMSFGIEKRRGFGRLQGYYGAEAGIGISSASESYEYGNAIVAANGMPDTHDWGQITTDTYGNVARTTESSSGLGFSIGARAFIGAEYFVMPRIAIGGEFGWGLGFGTGGTQSTTIESTDGLSVGEQVTEVSNGSGFGIDTDEATGLVGPSGSLRMTFHF